MNSPWNPPTTAHHQATPYTAADLPIDNEGRIYHLQIRPDQIAPNILLVGDPGRAETIGATFLRDLVVEHEHRGLVTVTGTAEVSGEQVTIIAPLKTTVTTSGMGTPSFEIVASELVALNEIDFQTRTRRADFPRLHVLRVGTSGALQASTALGTPIITSYAIGMDNTGMYYEAACADVTCARIEQEVGQLIQQAMRRDSRFYGRIRPYVSRTDPSAVAALSEAAATLGVPARVGLTVSAAGFFAPQGRDIARVKPTVPDLDQILGEYDPRVEGQRIENMEMETSFLLHFFGSLGYLAGTICPTIAHRQKNTFAQDYQDAVLHATRVALVALATLRNRS